MGRQLTNSKAVGYSAVRVSAQPELPSHFLFSFLKLLDVYPLWYILIQTIGVTPVRLVGPILPATTGTAACMTTDPDHARLAVYAPPRMDMSEP